MALMESTKSELGSKAHPFSLPGVDGKTYTLDSFRDKKSLLIVFMCNHCPYVIAVHDRLSRLARDFADQGLAVIGISSNDPKIKAADSFENMILTAREWKLAFPYVLDESQEVARAYDAVCTPDPYLYQNLSPGKPGGDFVLRYRGRIDDSWQDPAQIQEESLKLAIESVFTGRAPSPDQIPSMGCSIKWKS